MDQTYAAVILGGLHWNKEVEVLKADLSRCDGALPAMGAGIENVYHHKVSESEKIKDFQSSGCNAEQISSCMRWIF